MWLNTRLSNNNSRSNSKLLFRQICSSTLVLWVQPPHPKQTTLVIKPRFVVDNKKVDPAIYDPGPPPFHQYVSISCTVHICYNRRAWFGCVHHHMDNIRHHPFSLSGETENRKLIGCCRLQQPNSRMGR